MRRPAVGVAAVLLAAACAGCGQAGHGFLGWGTGGPPTTASNRAAARADARQLVGLVRVPSGSTSAPQPHVSDFDQSRYFIGAQASATASRSWIIHGGTIRVLRYVAAHLHGSKLDSWGHGPNYEMQIHDFPTVSGVLAGRWLEIQAYESGAHTYLTARAQSEWVVTRSPSERIPASVTKVTIRVTDPAGHLRRKLTVRRPRLVRGVVALYNSLGVDQPVTEFGCGPGGVGVIRVRFYSSQASLIATASSAPEADFHWPAYTAGWSCFPITLRLNGRSYPSLSGNVVTPLSKLLHTKLSL